MVSVCYRVVCSAQPCHSFYGRTVWASRGGGEQGWEGGRAEKGWGGQGGFFFSRPKLPRTYYGFQDMVGRASPREGFFFFPALNCPRLIMVFRTET